MHKKLSSLLILTLSLSGASAMAAPKKKATAHAAKAQAVKLDLGASTLGWTGRKVVGPHNGDIKIKSGQIEVQGEQLKGAQFEVDMATITDEDVKDPEYNKKLVGHLKSDDFFGVAKHPVSTFKMTSAKPLAKAEGNATHEITGDLTIKGITHPVTFPAKVEIKDGKAQAEGTMNVDRTKYEIRYGSGKFFQNLGDKMIDDNFQVQFKIVGQAS